MSGRTNLSSRFPVAFCDSRMVITGKIKLTVCMVLLSLFILPNLQAWQKSIHFDRITVEDGLPGGFARSFVQDGRGFMWIATDNGLAKYDGYRFTVYRNDPDDPESISSNEILSVFEDRQDTLWVGTDAGLDRFDREKETFRRFTHDPKDITTLGGPVVPTIYEDSQGVLWVGHWFGGLSKFDRDTETFFRFQHDPDDATSLPSGSVFAVLEVSSGDLWVGTRGGDGPRDLARLDRGTQTFHGFFRCRDEEQACPHPVAGSIPPPKPQVASIYEDKKGTIWIGGYGLTRYDPISNSYKQYYHDPDDANSLAGNSLARNLIQDENGLLWFPDTYNGLSSFDPETETFSFYQHDPANPGSIGGNDLFTIYRDNNGLIWTGSYHSGVSRFNPRSLAFGRYEHDSNDPHSLSSTQNIRDIVEDENELLWVAFEDNGLNRIDRKTGSVVAYQNNPDDPDSLHNNVVFALHIARSGDLWIGTAGGLNQFEPVTEQFELHSFSPDDMGVLSIAEDPEGLLWLSTSNAVHYYDPATRKTVHFNANPEKPGALHGDFFRISFVDDDGKVWITSQSAGINVFNPDTAAFSHYVHDPKNPDSLPQGPVQAIWQDGRDNIWVGTQSGLGQLDPESGVFRHYTGDGELPVGRVTNILPDDRGNLWVPMLSESLWKINPANGETRKYDRSDGFVSVSLEAGLLSRTGEMVIADNTGIYIFNLDVLPEPQPEPVIVMTDFLLMNERVPVSNDERKTPLARHINESDEITLTHEDYFFEFEFSALDYLDPMGIQYAYMLDGFDSDWIETASNKRFAAYTNVPSGEYVLRVKARRQHGDWGNNTASVKLTILPPWWQTWWMYSLYALAFLFALFSYIKLRTLTLRRRAGFLEETVEERTAQIREHEKHIQHQADDLEELLHLKEKLITNISHEFRTPLTLILGPAKRMLRKTSNREDLPHLQLIKRNSQRLLRLVDQLLGLARLGAEEPMVRSPQSLTMVVKAITESFQVLAKEKDLQLTLEQGDELWVSCAPDVLDKILLNLLSNAIKYTPAGGHVTVSTTVNGDMVELSVSDTGVGISEQDQQTVFERFHRADDYGEAVPGAGIGLALVKELVEDCDGRIQLDSKPGEGTTFTVGLPRCELASDTSANGIATVSLEAVELEVESIAQPDAVPVPASDHAEEGKPLILIVEDNPDMQNYLVQLLSDTYYCDVAGDGQQALDKAFESIPDLLLCDVMLPKLDGFQVTHAIREDERTSHIPIIMLTAREDRDSRMEGLQEKVDDYLTKPFDDEELKLRIANLLDIRDILRNRYSHHFFEEVNPGENLNLKENGFMEKLEDVLNKHYSDPEFDLLQMASAMHMSTRQLQRKLKAITGQNPAEFLRSFRLRKAREILRTGSQVGLTAEAVGFSSPTYFASCFKAQFAQTPSGYQQGFH